jgi:hypothetical protein
MRPSCGGKAGNGQGRVSERVSRAHFFSAPPSRTQPGTDPNLTARLEYRRATTLPARALPWIVLGASLIACFGMWRWAEVILIPSNTSRSPVEGDSDRE